MLSRKFIYLLVGLFVFTFVSSGLGTYAQDSCVEIRTILNSTTVNISSIEFPNNTVIFLDTSMTQNGRTFNYTFCQTSLVGKYTYDYYDDEGNVFVNDFIITPTGSDVTTGNSLMVGGGILLFFVISIVLFSFSFKDNLKIPVKWTLILGSMIFLITSITLISSIIPDALINERVVTFFSSFNAIAFYLFWFIFGIIALIWFLTFFNTLIFRNKENRLLKYG